MSSIRSGGGGSDSSTQSLGGSCKCGVGGVWGSDNDALTNGQLTTSSHNYTFQIIKLAAMNVKYKLSDSSNQLKLSSNVL